MAKTVCRKCNICQKEFMARPVDLNKGRGLCCSKSCASKRSLQIRGVRWPRQNTVHVGLGKHHDPETGEIWVPCINGDVGYYVSNMGRVKSFKMGRCKILVQNIGTGGYYTVRLYFNKKMRTTKVHRLVWESFNGATALTIDHIIEGNKLNNRLDNLQPLPSGENTSKYYRLKKTKLITHE